MTKHADTSRSGDLVKMLRAGDLCGLTLAADRIEALEAENERLLGALRVMIYETTHLSPMEPDGSHWCRITADALNIARAALNPF